jgi:hypothetical protein
MRLFKNVPADRQILLRRQFGWVVPWLDSVTDATRQLGLQQVSLSLFDHWLDHEEAVALLGCVPCDEQSVRNAKICAFAKSISATNETCAFARRGRRWSQLRFRQFADADAFFGPSKGRRMRSVVLPAQDALLAEGYDDTWHLVYRERGQVDAVLQHAIANGLHVLE